ncbi:MAG: ATP-binding protein [Candidatus Heimdallarchaeota archaeon]|nr:MAG: ATP-binding protein [Candidatus Heimdallarchaeota archaeon]
MKPWYEIVLPHSMIRSGHIKESFFVADLSNIIQGSAPPDYSNPQMFFQKTFLTRGLLSLLNTVQAKLCNEEGNGIIKLQTPFGGGKTHALIAIYHYVANGAELLNYLPQNLSCFKTKVVTIVGTNLNPLEGRKEDNICIHTIWGDIAYQIAGENGYKEFEANDLNRISPGKEKIRNFLMKHEPFLLLFDEIAEYVAKAQGIAVNESNLGIQTQLFLQELTEVISSLARSLLIITLPSHEYEDFSEKKLDTINRINRILGRVEAIETPVEREEIYRLVTKRLIEKVLLQKDRDVVISKYLQIYQKRRNELPDKIQDQGFSKRMRDSYPFHPELIDLLYDRWRSLSSFQGTRTILRILTRTLTYLWSSQENLDLILPMNVNLQESLLRNDFLRHINPQFKSVFRSDVIGFDSKANSLDKKYPDWSNLASGLSQTVFLNSFTLGEIPRGLTLSELKLSTINPQIHCSLISEILHQLLRTLYYLHIEDGRYYFSHEPNLNRKIQDIKDLFQEDFEEEIRKEIKRHIGKEITTFIWPNSSNEVPDNQQLKIVLIHPLTPKNSLKNWLEKKGTTFRQNKNTIIFAIPNESHLNELQNLVQTKLALEELKAKSNAKLHDISSEIKLRQDRIVDSLSYGVRKTYSILFDGIRTISLGLPQLDYEPLTTWYHRELLTREFVVSKLHYRKLIELFFSSGQCISTQKILKQFFINPNFFKIESAATIQQTICWGVEEGAFGIAMLSDNKIQTSSFFFSIELTPTQVTFSSQEVLLSKEIAGVIARKIITNPEINEVTIPEELDKVTPPDLLFTSRDETKTQDLYSLSLEVLNLESKSLPAFYRGVIMPLESKKAKISMEIKIDVKSEQEIPETTIDTTIKETVSQLGARITIISKEEQKSYEK